jgi:hypothetical protein
MTRRKEKRLDPFKKGVKEGAIKKSLDKAISPITAAVAEAINEKLQTIHPNTKLAAPMVQSAIKCAIIMGFAELLDIASPVIGDRTSFDPEKVDLASHFMRKYAGEKLGTEVIDLAVQIAPIVMSAFTEFNLKDLQEAIEEEEPSNITFQEEECATFVDRLKEEVEKKEVVEKEKQFNLV